MTKPSQEDVKKSTDAYDDWLNKKFPNHFTQTYMDNRQRLVEATMHGVTLGGNAGTLFSSRMASGGPKPASINENKGPKKP